MSLDDAAPFDPAVGEMVIATDAHGDEHHVRVVRGPWRNGPSEFVKVTVRFDSGDVMPWPLTGVRATPNCYPGMGCDLDGCDVDPRCYTSTERVDQ